MADKHLVKGAQCLVHVDEEAYLVRFVLCDNDLCFGNVRTQRYGPTWEIKSCVNVNLAISLLEDLIDAGEVVLQPEVVNPPDIH